MEIMDVPSSSKGNWIVEAKKFLELARTTDKFVTETYDFPSDAKSIYLSLRQHAKNKGLKSEIHLRGNKVVFKLLTAQVVPENERNINTPPICQETPKNTA